MPNRTAMISPKTVYAQQDHPSSRESSEPVVFKPLCNVPHGDNARVHSCAMRHATKKHAVAHCEHESEGRMKENPTHGGPDSKGAWPGLGLAAGFGWLRHSHPFASSNIHRQTEGAAREGWVMKCSHI